MKFALRWGVERRNIRVIPVALPGSSHTLELPDFRGSRHIVDFREPDRWALHKLRRAILGAKPGRKDQFLLEPRHEARQVTRASRLRIVGWAVECMRVTYDIKCRVANIYGTETIIVKTVFVRTHETAPHPVRTSLPSYLAPIGRTRVKTPLRVPDTGRGVFMDLDETDRFLRPGEVEDIGMSVDVPEGRRTIVSFGIHWLIPDEPMYRLSETGYLAIGRRGGIQPEDRDEYHPGQHNLDKPYVTLSPDWPNGWPESVSREEWNYYGAGEC